MATSLAEQLKKLAVPQSSIYTEEKKKASLLFDPKEAAQMDRNAFYEIAITGLDTLKTLNSDFDEYEETLFSQASKEFERAVQTKEINENLNRKIEKFLRLISPYIIMRPSHQALEWLVHRYHIHEYNQDAIMMMILPYHETKIFIRFVQMMDLGDDKNRWHWLQSLQKPGVPLTRQILHNQCVSNTSTLQFISKSVLDYVQEYRERASQLKTLFAFYCTTVIGTINSVKTVKESIVSAIFPTLIKGLDSTIDDFRSSAYIILGYLATRSSMKKKSLNDIIIKLLTSNIDTNYDIILVTNIILSKQQYNSIPLDVIYCISAERMKTICGYLNQLISQNINIEKFVLTFLSSILHMLQKDIEEFKRCYFLPELMIDDLNMSTQHPEKIIKCVIDTYCPKQIKPSTNGNGSDVEIIEDEDCHTSSIEKWYSVLLKSLENKYPGAFDKVIKDELNSDSEQSKNRREQFVKLLAFNPAISCKLGDTYLFESLNHTNSELRVQAVHYLKRDFKVLKEQNFDFLKESIVNRFNDEDSNVVRAVLDIPAKYLNDVLNETDLTNIFINILSKDLKQYKKWKCIIEVAIKKFCALTILPVSQKTILSLMPYLFPYDNESAAISLNIIESDWGHRFAITKKISQFVDGSSNSTVICQQVFKSLCKMDKIEGLLNYDTVDKTNTLDVCFYLLFKASSLAGTPIKDVTILLNDFLDFIDNRKTVLISGKNDLSYKHMPEVVKLGRRGSIAFPVLQYVFGKIIDDTNFTIAKPWTNTCDSTAAVLCRRLFDIFVTGSSISEYDVHYFALLQKLLAKVCSNTQETMEFLANISCGHILYAENPKDIITPELQLRAMKLFIRGIEHSSSWILNSNVVICMILFNLNNPLLIIRHCTVDIISNVLSLKCEKNNIAILLKELLEHKEEVILDHDQVHQVLHTILTQHPNRIFKKNCLNQLLAIIETSPAYVSSELMKILYKFNTSNVFSQLIKAGKNLEEKIKTNPVNHLDIYESKLLRHLFSRINERTVTSFSEDEVWNFISFCLNEYKNIILDEDQSTTSPSIIILKQITEDLFKKLPENRCNELVRLICCAGTFSNNPKLSSVAAKTIKKIHIDLYHFKQILDEMLNVADTDISKKKKSTVSMISHQLAETNEWKLGLTLLEYVQSKKKMSVDNGFVTVLFQILKKCLRFEEQSYVEYTKQLILSSLWYYCKKIVNENQELMKSLKAVFDIECVVSCIRGTQNPQTHNHALILLSHAAYMLPEQVLDHTMDIFTFMGSSVLRLDDAYSFQIINKIIETLIPIIVKIDRNLEDYSKKELMQLQGRVVPVVRIFATSVLDVPEHRRLPLYKKLIETLGPSRFLWVFLTVLIEAHLKKIKDTNKNKELNKNTRNLAEQESPITRMDFGQDLLIEFPPEIVWDSFVKILTFLKSLPLVKDDNENDDTMKAYIDPKEIFCVEANSANYLRHYKYLLITFVNSSVSSSILKQHSTTATNQEEMENKYEALVVNILTFIMSISKMPDKSTNKYLRVMLHYGYELLDNVINQFSPSNFLSVIKGLLKHEASNVKRKAMEILSAKIQSDWEYFGRCRKDQLFALVPALFEIIKTIETKDETSNEAQLDLEINQQTALLSMKLLIRNLALENPEIFMPLLEQVTKYICNLDISDNVMSSVVLCLAELCTKLKAHSLNCLRDFMPALIKVLRKQRKGEAVEFVLLSTMTAISKIVESVPRFLSPYLDKILLEYALLLAKIQSNSNVKEDPKVSSIANRLREIRENIATSIPPRILIPVISDTYKMLLRKELYDAIGPIMAVLGDCFSNVTVAEISSYQQDTTTLFLLALQLRSDVDDKQIELDVIDKAEHEVVNALVCLVLKLSETSFRPFYFKIYDWAIRSNVDGQKERVITFYRLSSAIADKLKGLFVLFASHFIKNAAELLDACNVSKNENLYFDCEDKCSELIKYILKTLRIVFLYDNQSFLNRERFETLMQPMVDQLENTLLGLTGFKERTANVLIPCISQFAVATADDSLWKLLNYQILLKTRHNDAEIRLLSMECLVAMATQLGSGWLPLLAESVPFFAELLEDGDQKIEVATKDSIRKLEHILGEPLEKYF